MPTTSSFPSSSSTTASSPFAGFGNPMTMWAQEDVMSSMASSRHSQLQQTSADSVYPTPPPPPSSCILPAGVQDFDPSLGLAFFTKDPFSSLVNDPFTQPDEQHDAAAPGAADPASACAPSAAAQAIDSQDRWWFINDPTSEEDDGESFDDDYDEEEEPSSRMDSWASHEAMDEDEEEEEKKRLVHNDLVFDLRLAIDRDDPISPSQWHSYEQRMHEELAKPEMWTESGLCVRQAIVESMRLVAARYQQSLKDTSSMTTDDRGDLPQHTGLTPKQVPDSIQEEEMEYEYQEEIFETDDDDDEKDSDYREPPRRLSVSTPKKKKHVATMRMEKRYPKEEEEEEEEWLSEDDEDFPVDPQRRTSILSCLSTVSSNSTGKKTRKNYSRETTRILMDWYLQRGGKTPDPEHKEKLAKQANKSLVQSKAFFSF